MRTINRQGVDFLVVTDTENNSFWNIDLWEQDNYVKIKELSKTHDTFVHAGGWIGPFTLFSSKLFNSVYCLEPDSEAYGELKRNIEVNNFNNIKLSNKAFFNKEDGISIGSDFSPLGRSGTSMFQNNHAISVGTITLNRYFTENNIPKNSLLMLDVEGAEYSLFDDVEFFETFKPTILISYHLTFMSDEHFNYLISSLVLIKHIYDIDIDELLDRRKSLSFGEPFVELNYLYNTII